MGALEEFAYKTYEVALEVKGSIDDVNYIFAYIEKNNIAEVCYRKTIFDIVFRYGCYGRKALERVLKHYKYISRNEEAVKILYQRTIDTYGKNEDAFDCFITALEKYELDEKKKYEKLSLELDSLNGYSIEYINYLKSIMQEDFISIDELIVPDNSLVSKDENQVNKINYLYGLNYMPYSYTLTRLISLGEEDRWPHVYETQENELNMKFTKDDFMGSIHKANEIKKTIKM